MVKTLYVVRHAERLDDICEFNGSIDRCWDDPSLSDRGREQSYELSLRFDDAQINHAFSSPFDRCMVTASIMIGPRRDLPIKAEPGLCEVLYLCENPPGFMPPDKLELLFRGFDPNYEPLFSHRTLPNEPFGILTRAAVCIPRVRQTLEYLFEKYKNADILLLITHNSVIGAIHQLLVGEWAYVGQATVTKYVRIEEDKCADSKGCSIRNDQIREGRLGKWRCEYRNDSRHLGERVLLRDGFGARLLAGGVVISSLASFLISSTVSYMLYQFEYWT